MRNMSKNEKATLINSLVAEGKTTRQVAKQLGISHQRLIRVARRHGILMPYRGSVKFSTWTNYRRGAVVLSLSEHAEVSPGVILDRIIASVVDDGVEAAIKRLGKLALPKRKYGGEE